MEIDKMGLNWIFEVIIGIFCLFIFIFIITLLFIRYYDREKRRWRYLPSLFHFLFIISATFAMTFMILADLFLIKEVMILYSFCIVPFIIFAIIHFDYNMRESIEPIKLTLISCMLLIMVLTSFHPNSLIYETALNGDVDVNMSGYLSVSVFFVITSFSLMEIYLYVKLYLASPKNLKKLMITGILGSFLIIMSVFASIISIFIPGNVYLFLSFGLLLCSWPMLQNPKYFYILPFKVHRMIVIETNRGIPLFTYTWREDVAFVDETLFTGMMHALSLFINESLQSGNVKEIKLDNSLLLIERSDEYPVACVLICTKPSKTLRHALNSFAQRFFNEFAGQFSEFHNLEEKFSPARQFIDEYFAFLPTYENETNSMA